jgi:hypothetical protein
MVTPSDSKGSTLSPWDRFTTSEPLLKHLRAQSQRTGVIKDHRLAEIVRERYGMEFNDSRDNKSVVDHEALYQTLHKYGEWRNFRPDPKAFAQAVAAARRQFSRFNLTPLPIERSTLLNAINLDRNSGYPDFTSKLRAFPRAFAKVERRFRRRWYGDLPPCVSFHRVQHGDSGPKTRLIWGYPLEVTLMEAVFARPLIDEIISSDTPILLGKRKYDIGCRMLQLSVSGVKHCFDFSKFDASISPKLISIAFEILRANFGNLSREYQCLWDRIVNYFIHTPIIMFDGKGWMKHAGIPSGSYFTQLVGSVVNFILINYVCIRHFGMAPQPGHIYVLGDDSVFTLPGPLDMNAVARTLHDEFSMTLSVEKSLVIYANNCHFLGHYWYQGMARRRLRELFRSLIYSERYHEGDYSLLRRLKIISLMGEDPVFEVVGRWLLRKLKPPHERHLYLIECVSGKPAEPTGLMRLFQLGRKSGAGERTSPRPVLSHCMRANLI